MKTIKTLFIAATFTALAAAGAPVLAQSTMAAKVDAGMADGEVRKVDKEQGKVTLKHGPIKNLDMPGMTMVFTVKDKAMLDAVKAGDKVKFKASNENGRMTVVEMAAAN